MKPLRRGHRVRGYSGLMNKPKPSGGELRALRERTELLESLSDVGVALAGSFDIQSILETTHGAAVRIRRGGPADVLYLGCDTINSRPLWYPAEPSEGNVDRGHRERVERQAPGLVETAAPGRVVLPISYQDEELGYLFVQSTEALGPETTRLLSILTLQAATALRNIHLTQERIHFERLSTIGRMIGSVVHDFRSPITALRGYAGMLVNLKLDAAERAAYGRYMIEECDRLNQMVDELLEFSRGGRLELDPAWIRVEPFARSFAGRLRAHFGARGIRVELDLDYTDELYVDKGRLDRALWNVATNACQAMPDGGRLLIRSQKTDDTISLAIEDEGSGIPDELRHRIFEPFFSFGKSEGIGLGMLIARKIAEEHGGRITVDSKEGVGTRVRFDFPATPVEASAPVEATTAQSGD